MGGMLKSTASLLRPRDQIRPFRIVEGKDDWLFMRGDRNTALDQHAGTRTLTSRERRRWRTLLESRVRRMSEIGVRWQGLIAPDKESVYPEMLPADFVASNRRPVHDVLDAVEAASAPVAYGLRALQDAKHSGRPYDPTESHWNYLGSYVAYREIIAGLASSGLSVEPVDSPTVRWYSTQEAGDLGSHLEPPAVGTTTRACLGSHSSRIVADNRIANHGRLIRFERFEPIDGLRCLLIGESFANQLLLYLKETFDQLTFMHTSTFDFDTIRRERPAAVIWVPTERFLIVPPSDRMAARRLDRLRSQKVAAGRLREHDRFLEGIPGSRS